MTGNIFDDVRMIVRLQLGIRKVTEHQRLIEDLGAESVDVVNIISAVESTFGISFQEFDIPNIRTVADICDYVGRYASG